MATSTSTTGPDQQATTSVEDEKKKIEGADTNVEKKNDESSAVSDSTASNTVKVEETKSAEQASATEAKKEEPAEPASAPSTAKVDEDTKKEESTAQAASSNEKKDAFAIERGDGEHLTSFQRDKAKYFFNVNLDIENKEHVTWEDVEFYLLFHVTASGKEGSNNGDLEARLSRAARALWEHIHDQIPLAEGKRDRLTREQFLDMWAGLVDYTTQKKQLPSVVEELVKLGFELYATEGAPGSPVAIQPSAFDQLFQKMNLGRPYAVMAYKVLSKNGSVPLDAGVVEGLVRSVITSSDDEDDSHFLIPGFFKTMANQQNKSKETTSTTEGEATPSTTESEKPKVTSTPQATESSPSSTTTTTTSQVQKSSEPPRSEGQKDAPSQEKKREGPAPSLTQTSTGPTPQPIQQQQQQQNAPKATLQQEDENIRRLLRYYRIDDGDLIEVAAGSPPRLVLVHPERPLPPYILRNKELVQKLQSGSSQPVHADPIQHNDPRPPTKQATTTVSPDTRPKVSLQERVARGEAQTGPSVPFRQEQQPTNVPPTGVHQVYPSLSDAEHEQQRQHARLQATQPPKTDEQQAGVAKEAENPVLSSSSHGETHEKKDLNHDDEEKIVAAILKQLTPLIEKRVADEVRRIHSGQGDEDDDDADFLPFPFMFAGGAQMPPQMFQQQQQGAFHPGQRPPREMDMGGLPPGAAFIPPQLLMAMMSDLVRGGQGGEMPGFPPSGPPPPHGPIGVEGFMYVDGDPSMGGPSGFPPRSGPRF